jgi:tetratricopeptide (TPR) repeat protein
MDRPFHRKPIKNRPLLRSDPEPTQRHTKPQRAIDSLGTWLKTIVSFVITSFHLAIAILALPLLFFVAREVTRPAFIIDPISVPKLFEEAGHSPEAMAQEVKEQIDEIQSPAEASEEGDSKMPTYSGAEIHPSSRPVITSLIAGGPYEKVEVPGTGLNIEEVVNLARKVFNYDPTTHIGGVVVFTKLDFTTPQPGANTQATAHVFLTREGRQAYLGDTPASTDASAIAKGIARLAIRQINPYAFAKLLESEATHPGAANEDKTYSDAIEAVEGLANSLPWGRSGSYKDRVALESALNLWGILLFDQKKYAEAEEEYRRAIDICLKDPLPYSNLGNALLSQRNPDYEGALPNFLSAIQLNPRFSAAHNGLGLAYSGLQKYPQAEAEFNTATGYSPACKGCFVSWGVTLNNESKFDGAIERFKQAIAVDPDYGVAYNGLGVALAMKRQIKEAIPYFQKALELDPKNAQARENLTEALSDLRRPPSSSGLPKSSPVPNR